VVEEKRGERLKKKGKWVIGFAGKVVSREKFKFKKVGKETSGLQDEKKKHVGFTGLVY